MTMRSTLLAISVSSISLLATSPGFAATTSDLNRDCRHALQQLIANNPTARELSRHAVAELIFPNIVKAGFVFGAAYGEGELRQGMTVDSYYNSFTASWGLQAGAESYGYVVFLMTPYAVKYIHRSEGWEIGVGPTVVVVNEGMAKNLTTSTLKGDAYAFIFDQQGLMASVSIEGTKISQIKQ